MQTIADLLALARDHVEAAQTASRDADNELARRITFLEQIEDVCGVYKTADEAAVTKADPLGQVTVHFWEGAGRKSMVYPDATARVVDEGRLEIVSGGWTSMFERGSWTSFDTGECHYIRPPVSLDDTSRAATDPDYGKPKLHPAVVGVTLIDGKREEFLHCRAAFTANGSLEVFRIGDAETVAKYGPEAWFGVWQERAR